MRIADKNRFNQSSVYTWQYPWSLKMSSLLLNIRAMVKKKVAKEEMWTEC